MATLFYLIGIIEMFVAFAVGSTVLGLPVAVGIFVSALFMFAAGYIVEALGKIRRASERNADAAEATLEVMRAIRERRPERPAAEITARKRAR